MKAKESVLRTKRYAYPETTKKILLKLEYNEPQIPPSPEVKEALKEFVNTGKLEWYPGGDCAELRTALSKYTGAKPEQIIAGNGSDEILKTIAFTYLSEGDDVIIPVPNYSMFGINAEVIGARVVEIESKELEFPLVRIITAVNSNTKAVYLSNPNSPTGRVISREEIIKLVEAVDCIVVVDEAYFEFYGQSVVDLVEKYDNLIVTRTFSKAFSIASLRLGYAISQEQNIAEMLKVKDPESVNTLAQIAGVSALEDLDYVRNYVKETIKTRKLMADKLAELGIAVESSNANFVLARIQGNATDITTNLRAQGILVRDRSKEVPNSIRIAVPTPDKLGLLLESLRRAMKPLLIFDMDGVLVDVSGSYRQVIQKVVKYFTGESITDEDVQALKNEGGYNNDWDTSKELIRRRGKQVERGLVIEKFQEFYLGTKDITGLIDEEIWLFDKGALAQIASEYNLAIVTGRPKAEANYALKKNKVKEFPQEVIAMEDVDKGKPNPEGILAAIKKFPSFSTYYFGDTVDDIKAALSANAIGIGVLPPGAKQEQAAVLEAAGAKRILDSINKIKEVLE